MFVFEDILLLDDKAIQRVLRDVDNNDLAVALKGANEQVQNAIFNNLSKRLVVMIKEGWITTSLQEHQSSIMRQVRLQPPQRPTTESILIQTTAIHLWVVTSATRVQPKGEGFQYQKTSFTKVKNVTLGYTLPKNVVSKAGIRNLRVYMNILNPFCFTNYKGFDPEWASQSLQSGGPSSVTYQFGVNLKF